MVVDEIMSPYELSIGKTARGSVKMILEDPHSLG